MGVLKWFFGVLLAGVLVALLGAWLSRDILPALPPLYSILVYWPAVAGFGLLLAGGLSGAVALDRRSGRIQKWERLSTHFVFVKEGDKISADRDLDIQEYREAYLQRGLEEEAQAAVAAGKGFLVVGKPTSGKTRLCYQVLQGLKGWYVLYPRAETLPDLDISGLKGKKVVLLLNDLHKYAEKFDPQGLWKGLKGSASVCGLLANCRDGEELRLAEGKMDYFVRTLRRKDLEDLQEQQGRGLAVAVGKEWSQVAFDGTPGSVLLDLRAMAGRYKSLTAEPKAALWAIKLLHAGAIYEVTRELAQAVCQDLWGVSLPPYQWHSLWDDLQEKSFVKLSHARIWVYEPYLEHCVTDYPAPPDDLQQLFELLRSRQDGARLLYLGNAQYVAGRRREASQCYAASLAVAETPQAHNNYATLLEDGSKDEAERHLKEALRLRPDYPQAHYNYGNLLLGLGRNQEAEAHYEEVLRLRPDYPDAHNNYGFLLAGLGRNQEAEAHYEEAVRLNPDDAGGHNNYGGFLKKIGRHEEAEVHYEEALRLNPDYPDAHNNYGNLLMGLGRNQVAEAHYQQALRLRPDYPEAHSNYGILLEALGRKEEAAAHHKEALRLRPDDPTIHSNYAALLQGIGLQKEASAHYEEALRLNPDYPPAHGNYAVLLDEMGHREEAEAHYQVALRLLPGDPGLHQNYALLLEEMGRTAEAENHRREAERLRKEKKEPRGQTGP